MTATGIEPLDPGHLPPGGVPDPLPPGGRLPGEEPPHEPDQDPNRDPDQAPVQDPGIGDPATRRLPDHLPGGPSNPHPHL